MARDSCDVTHSLKHASIHPSHVHASKSCTKYSLHLVPAHTNALQTSPRGDVASEQHRAKAVVKKARQSRAVAQQADLLARLPQASRLSVELASEKGASSWLTTLPMVELGFHLNKSEFRDGLCLRYNWSLHYLPSHCVCGQALIVEHALSCAVGGLPSQRHNHIRDLTAHFVVRSGQQRWCGASTFTTIWRGIALALSQHRRPGSTGFRSVLLLGVTSRACIVRCKGVQSLCALVCDFTDRHYVPTP